MVNNITENMKRKVIKLTDLELKKLRAKIIGYGNLSSFSELVGLNRRTLERISLTGKGEEPNIEKIREHLPAK